MGASLSNSSTSSKGQPRLAPSTRGAVNPNPTARRGSAAVATRVRVGSRYCRIGQRPVIGTSERIAAGPVEPQRRNAVCGMSVRVGDSAARPLTRSES
jgi:hypothetical protein